MEKILSVIMPVYNEQKTLGAIIEKVMAVPFVKELIIVNDCSTDNSALVLESFQYLPALKIIHHSSNLGKGAAIRTAINHITAPVTIIQDADLEYDPQDYSLLIEPILAGREQVVYGSRFLLVHLDRQKNKMVIDRPNLVLAMLRIISTMITTKILSKINKNHPDQPHIVFFLGGIVVTLTTNILYGQRLTDEPTCYKMFESGLLKSIDLRCERFEFCPEVTAKISRRGIKIMEFPIHYYPRKVEEGKKIKWYDGAEAIWTLLKYRFINESGRLTTANTKSAVNTYNSDLAEK